MKQARLCGVNNRWCLKNQSLIFFAGKSPLHHLYYTKYEISAGDYIVKSLWKWGIYSFVKEHEKARKKSSQTELSNQQNPAAIRRRPAKSNGAKYHRGLCLSFYRFISHSTLFFLTLKLEMLGLEIQNFWRIWFVGKDLQSEIGDQEMNRQTEPK